MKSIRLNPPAWLRPLRLLLATCICALLVLSQALPASATRGSSPTSGEANLTKIEKEAQEAVLKDPYSLEETKNRASQGALNEVQGTADIEKMKRPDNTRAGVESVEQKIQKALEKAEGKKVED